MPRTRKSFARAAAVCVLLFFPIASPVSAAPITLTFDTTLWTLNDLEYKGSGCISLESQCALADGLAALGIIFNDPSGNNFGNFPPIYWSFTIDDNNQGGIDVTGALTLGTNTYDISDASGSIGGGALWLAGSLTGPPLASSYGYTPTISTFGFGYASAAFTSNQVSSTNWTNPALFVPTGSLFFGVPPWIMSQPGNQLIWLEPRLVSVSVPEPSALISLSGALLTLGVFWFARRFAPRVNPIRSGSARIVRDA